MIAALFYLIPLVAAGAMAWWLHRTRQTSRYWIAHWIAALAPMGLLAALHGLGLVTNTLASVLIVPAVLGVAAFAGGALYLVGPTLLVFLLWALQVFITWFKSEPQRHRAQYYDNQEEDDSYYDPCPYDKSWRRNYADPGRVDDLDYR